MIGAIIFGWFLGLATVIAGGFAYEWWHFRDRKRPPNEIDLSEVRRRNRGYWR